MVVFSILAARKRRPELGPAVRVGIVLMVAVGMSVWLLEWMDNWSELLGWRRVDWWTGVLALVGNNGGHEKHVVEFNALPGLGLE